MQENWLEINGFPGYFVSSLGRIKGIKGTILRPASNGKGYLSVQLGRKTRKYVHRLVAIAFLKPPEPFEINHINFDKTDNRLINLELSTRQENQRHMIKGGRHNKAKLTVSNIKEIYRLKAEGYTISTIAKHFKVSTAIIFNLITGKTWTWI